jgi:predicted RNA polymerase sigma factor
MDASLTRNFQPWWVAKAYLLSLGNEDSREQACAAYQTAIGLTVQQRVKRYLEAVRHELLALIPANSDQQPGID